MRVKVFSNMFITYFAKVLCCAEPHLMTESQIEGRGGMSSVGGLVEHAHSLLCVSSSLPRPRPAGSPPSRALEQSCRRLDQVHPTARVFHLRT